MKAANQQEPWPRVTLGTYYEGIEEPVKESKSSVSPVSADFLADLLEEWPRITLGTKISK
ncbi:MAG: hypothetical protein GXY34_13035 [Syntrophomonadaceae bacterium]|nr:hypothetical protein [Syntrophomonadaceae bacterium]